MQARRIVDDTTEAALIKARRIDLGRFLRERRNRLRPADVDRVTPGRRHVRGLRRDEVAALANIGVSWYTMLEQGRVENFSPRTLAAVARALRMTGSEREHLFKLAASSFEELTIDASPPPRELTTFVEHVRGGMAFITSPLFDVVAYNDQADAFFRLSHHGAAPNLLRIMVTDPEIRTRFETPSWREVLAQMIGHFRMWSGRIARRAFSLLVEELRADPTFAAIWASQSLSAPPGERTILNLPSGERRAYRISSFTSFTCPTYTVIFKSAYEPAAPPAEPYARAEASHNAERYAADEKRRRLDLGAFLRHRRERMAPADIGLVPIGRRRAKGLRRDEIAERAGIGVSWYTMLEQGRVENITRRTLVAVADALMLTHRERLYLERLSAQAFVDFPSFDSEPPPDLLAFVRTFPDAHAHFHDARFAMLAWNADADDLYRFSAYADPNLLHVMATDPRMRSAFAGPDWYGALKRMLAHFRFTCAHVRDANADAVIAAHARSAPEFAAIWSAAPDVQNPAIESGLLAYPSTGLRAVDVILLTPTTLPTHTLVLKPRATGRVTS